MNIGGKAGAKVICGSTNLTRSGCASNLEVINAVTLNLAEPNSTALAIANEAFRFFNAAAEKNETQTGRILSDWLLETSRRSWLSDESTDGIQLVHSYKRPLWQEMESAIGEEKVSEFLIASPFHDKRCDLEKRLFERWPNAKVRLVVQQHYTTLNAGQLNGYDNCRIAELKNASRRLHAKVIAWKTESGSGCIVGSANFTSAAFDGRNVEASLLIPNSWDQCLAMFSGDQSLSDVALDKFEPGESQLPEEAPVSKTPIFIESAVLRDGVLTLKVRCRGEFSSPTLSIHAPSERNPREKRKPTSRSADVIEHRINDSTLSDSPSTLLVAIEAVVEGQEVKSPATWIVQEHRLTHESSGGSGKSDKKMRETGEGLADFLDALAERDGAAAAAAYLNNLTIGFSIGGRSGNVRRFRVKILDPFRDDRLPDWVAGLSDKEKESRAKAVYAFYERHVKLRIRKHARAGNINGMANFADIFHTILQLMAREHKRGHVPAGKLIGKINRLIELSTSGDGDDLGFLYSIWNNVGGDSELISEVCDETEYVAELRAAMIFAQHLRLENEPKDEHGVPKTPSHELLTDWSKELTNVITECELNEPTRAQVSDVFERYGAHDAGEIETFLKTFDLATA